MPKRRNSQPQSEPILNFTANANTSPARRAMPPPSAPLQSTPHSNRMHAHDPYTSTHYVDPEPYLGMADEMAGRFREYPIDKFLDLLPDVSTPMPEPDYNMLEVVASSSYETDMYDPFNRAMSQWVQLVGCFHNTSKHKILYPAQVYGMIHISPDGAMYLFNRIPDQPEVPDPERAEMFYEVKKDEVDEPFGYQPWHKFERDTEAARKTRGQIAMQINAIQSSQQRTAVFHIFFLERYCRLFYHTRAGTLVTPRFDFTKVDFLHQFLWRYSHASPAQRGHDTTFQRFRLIRYSTRLREAQQTDLVKQEQKEAQAAYERLDLAYDAPLYKVYVGSEFKVDEKAPDYVYVSEPFTRTHKYIVGRGTRCFSAYDPVNERVVMLKDTWRLPTYEPEHLVYASLHEAGVPNIAGVVAAGEVAGQVISLPAGDDEAKDTTDNDCDDEIEDCDVEIKDSDDEITDNDDELEDCDDGMKDDHDDEEKCCDVPKEALGDSKGEFEMRHYRMVLDCVGVGLDDFKSSHELMSCVTDAVEAHKAAVEMAKILHRDISVGNIIIVGDRNGKRKGMLIDWERAKRLDSDEGARATERTGTWQFMAMKLLEKCPPPHQTEHDIESVIYVALWMAAKYAPNNMPELSGRTFFKAFDYHAYDAPGVKLSMLRNEPLDIIQPHNPNLRRCLLILVARLLDARADFDLWRMNWELVNNYLPEQERTEAIAAASRRFAYARASMQNHDWLLETLREALNNPDWEAARDSAVPQPVPSVDPPRPKIPVSNRRERDMQAYVLSAKRQRIAE